MEGNFVTSDFMRVLLALEEKISHDIHCANVCKITSITDGIVSCVPLGSEQTIQAIPLNNLTLYQGDIILVIYADTDFRINLKKIKQSQQTNLTSDDEERHSNTYGVIVGTLYTTHVEEGE